MASAEDKDDIRYFLLFLQTHPANELHERITEYQPARDLLRELFSDLADEAGRLRAFDDVVNNLRLPKATRRQHALQMITMKEIMRVWSLRGLYDIFLDRFLQYLRMSIGKGTLEDLLISLCGDNEAEARRVAQQIGQLMGGNWMGIRARNMNDDVRRSLADFMATMQRENAYRSAQYSITTSSSGESSDDNEVEDELIFDGSAA